MRIESATQEESVNSASSAHVTKPKHFNLASQKSMVAAQLQQGKTRKEKW